MSGVCDNSSSFDPSSLVESFHGIPHVDIDLDDSPTDFDTDLEYFEAVIIWACVPILACICIFILMSVYFICVCCCCCCGERDSPPSKGSKGGCGFIIIFLVVISLAMTGVALWAEFELDKSVNDFTDTAQDVDDILVQFGDASPSYNEATVNASLESLRLGIEDEPPSEARNQSLINVQLLEIVNVDVGTVFAEIESEIPSYDSGSIDDIEMFETIRHWVVVAYVLLVALFLVLTAIAICCGVGLSSPACVVMMLVVLFFVTLTVWIAVGGGLALLMVSSDICHDPDDLVRRFADDNDDSLVVVNYYIACSPSCGPNPFSDSIALYDNATMDLEASEEFIQDYITNNSLTAELQQYLDTVVAGFDGAEEAVMSIETCTELNNDYLDILDSLCDTAFLNAVIVFSMACGLAIAFMLIMVCGTFYAGLLSATKSAGFEDDETVPYDFGPPAGTSTWEAYGTQQNYSRPGQYTQFQESYNLTPQHTSPTAAEPPKYHDLQHNYNQPGERTSGTYDHFDT